MSKQVQIRRDTETNLNATTPALGELAYDITRKRLRAGDGSTQGGIYQASARDVQENWFTYVAASGTNTITATYAPAVIALTAGMTLGFKAAGNNTGAATFSPNGLTAKNIYKRSGGTLGPLVSGDIISGGMYKITYDGTQWQLDSVDTSGSGGIKQGDINTSTGIVSASLVGNTTSNFSNATVLGTLPGGQYAFGFETRVGSGSTRHYVIVGNNSTTYSRTASGINMLAISATIFAQERYITSSPPFDMGDGEAAGFLFAQVNNAGEVMRTYFADVPPWGYNGPTSVRCDHICPKTGKKFRKVHKKRSLEEIMNGAVMQEEYQEITQKVKNADMGLIPHPFMDVDTTDSHIVLIDPLDDRMAAMIAHLNAGGGQEITEALYSGKMYVDNTPLKRKGPAGVIQVGLRYKYSGRK